MKLINSALVVLAFFTLSACSKEDNSISYELTEDNCATGKQTFSDKGAMCEALKDSARNNFCAYSLRKQKFAAECSGKFGIVSETTGATSVPNSGAPSDPAPTSTIAGEAASSKNLQVPTEQLGAMPKGSLTAQIETSKEIKEMKITGLFSGRAKLASNISGDSVISMIDGTINVQKSEPETQSARIQLMTATAINFVSPNLGKCELTMRNFSDPTVDQNQKQIAFSLLGIDSTANLTATGCAGKLGGMAAGGFIVEFENVRVGNALNSVTVPKVRLEVEP